MTLQHYLTISREPRYSVLYAFPLLGLYEVLAFALSDTAMQGVRNGADVLLKTAFLAFGGARGVAVFTFLLVAAGAWFVMRDWRRHPGRLDARVFGWMVGESVLYALMLGGAVSYLTNMLLGGGTLMQVAAPQPVELGLGAQLVISLGAGLYEELLFRVLLVSAVAWGGLKLGWSHKVAFGVAVVVSALIFSGFHYVGPMGDVYTPQSFVYRTVAGLVLSGLYVTRGFGIVAWTHALYDVWVSVI